MNTNTSNTWKIAWMYLLFEPIFFLLLMIGGKRNTVTDTLSLLYTGWLVIGFILLRFVLTFCYKHFGKTFPVLKTKTYVTLRTQLLIIRLTAIVDIIGMLQFYYDCKQTGKGFWNLRIFSHPDGIYSWAFALIPAISLFGCIGYIFMVYISTRLDDSIGNIKSIKHLGRLKTNQINDEKNLLYVLYKDSSLQIDESLLFKHELFAPHICLQEPNAYERLYKRNANKIIETATIWCFLIYEPNINALQERLQKIDMQYTNVATARADRSVIVVNYVPHTSNHFMLPKEYQQKPWLIYKEIHDLSAFTLNYVLESQSRERETYNQYDTFNTKQTAFYYFEHITEFRDMLCKKGDLEANFSCQNQLIETFYINANHFRNPARSVMALLDYLEMILRFITIYIFVQKESTEEASYTEKELLQGKFFPMANYIVQNASLLPEEIQNRLLSKKEIPYDIIEFIQFLGKKMNMTFENNSVSFLGAVSLIQAIRNRIVAHGVLNRENAAFAWAVLYWGTMLINHYLMIEDFTLIMQDKKCQIGYDNILKDTGKYVITYNQYPCLALEQKQNSNMLYINYFDGTQITPEIFSK
ncbi:MAG: hypothetical protein IJ485_00860 [Lachnospiraceae bacterium]|nr:hypothetical protein [Lachnospiraceae bacterium]